MKKRIILFSTLALVLAVVLIWCTLPKETLASISGGELKMVRISAINPDKRNPTHQKTLELTEGELFAQYADFFYHHAVSPKSVQSMEEMVYTEESLAYDVGYTFVLEPGEQGIYCVGVDPLGDSGALFHVSYTDLNKPASLPQRIQLPSGSLFDSKTIHKYVWEKGK